ncbi:MAG TPA: T9SS type A sorting domain-containing protein [Flavisolibacter sp.]|nr:T9SS type A sorting domain-containing protein [Flavisolibacter sp.]
MKRKILLSLLLTPFVATLHAQKNTAYAITGSQKGQTNWSEVRLIDLSTGEEVKTVYKKALPAEVLNARTGKAILSQDPAMQTAVLKENENKEEIIRSADGKSITIYKRSVRTAENKNEPFATKSAAAAYDKKHERLYYTPMGINQLRYIDLKSKTPKVLFFEDEQFGVLTGSHDVANQITRMVIASDGNGYALTNNAQHLIRFTTGKKPTITDLGALTDDGVNAVPVQSSVNYGGDLIADTKKNLYLIGANKKVYKINIESRVATYLGTIKGLPKGFSTNGAVVEGGTKVIVSSSNSTEGYFRFDIKDLMASRLETSGTVYNASDLANANLLSVKEQKKEEVKEEAKEPETVVATTSAEEQKQDAEVTTKTKISVYPNPVLNGHVKLLFEDQASGRYQVQFLDIAGRVIRTQAVNIDNKWQVEEFAFPELNVKGNYLVRVVDTDNKVVFSNKLVVQ